MADATLTFEKFCDVCKITEVKKILDIGAGESQRHTKKLKTMGFEVETCDLHPNNTYQGDFLTFDLPIYDAIWCCNTMEHMRNVGLFLDKCNICLKEGGILGINIPPLKHQIVGGHVTLWNAGLLIYNLILAKFNCRNISIRSYGYNIGCVLSKISIKELPVLACDRGDIETLSEYFPKKYDFQGFNGQIASLNWETQTKIQLI